MDYHAQRKRIKAKLGQWREPLYRKPSAWLAVFLNLIPFLGIAFLGWKLEDVVFLYWVEASIFGVYSIPKLCLLYRNQANPKSVSFTFIPLFIVFFILLHRLGSWALTQILQVNPTSFESTLAQDASYFSYMVAHFASPYPDLMLFLGQSSLLAACICVLLNSTYKLYEDVVKRKLIRKYSVGYSEYLFWGFVAPCAFIVGFIVLRLFFSTMVTLAIIIVCKTCFELSAEAEIERKVKMAALGE